MPSSLLEFAKKCNVNTKSAEIPAETGNSCIRSIVLTFPGYPSKCTEIVFNFEEVRGTVTKGSWVKDSNVFVASPELHEVSNYNTISDWIFKSQAIKRGGRSIQEDNESTVYIDFKNQLIVAEQIQNKYQRSIPELPILSKFSKHWKNCKSNRGDNNNERQLPFNKGGNVRDVCLHSPTGNVNVLQDQNGDGTTPFSSSRTFYTIFQPNLETNLAHLRKQLVERLNDDKAGKSSLLKIKSRKGFYKSEQQNEQEEKAGDRIVYNTTSDQKEVYKVVDLCTQENQSSEPFDEYGAIITNGYQATKQFTMLKSIIEHLKKTNSYKIRKTCCLDYHSASVSPEQLPDFTAVIPCTHFIENAKFSFLSPNLIPRDRDGMNEILTVELQNIQEQEQVETMHVDDPPKIGRVEESCDIWEPILDATLNKHTQATSVHELNEEMLDKTQNKQTHLNSVHEQNEVILDKTQNKQTQLNSVHELNETTLEKVLNKHLLSDYIHELNKEILEWIPNNQIQPHSIHELNEGMLDNAQNEQSQINSVHEGILEDAPNKHIQPYSVHELNEEILDTALNKHLLPNSVHELTEEDYSVKTSLAISHQKSTTEACALDSTPTIVSCDALKLCSPVEKRDSETAYPDKFPDSNNCFDCCVGDQDDSSDKRTTLSAVSSSDELCRESCGSTEDLIPTEKTTHQQETAKEVHNEPEITKSVHDILPPGITTSRLMKELTETPLESVEFTNTSASKSDDHSCEINLFKLTQNDHENHHAASEEEYGDSKYSSVVSKSRNDVIDSKKERNSCSSENTSDEYQNKMILNDANTKLQESNEEMDLEYLNNTKESKLNEKKCLQTLLFDHSVIVESSYEKNIQKNHDNEEEESAQENEVGKDGDTYAITAIKSSKLHRIFSKSTDYQDSINAINLGQVDENKSTISNADQAVIVLESESFDEVPLLLPTALQAGQGYISVATSCLGKASKTISSARSRSLSPAMTKIKRMFIKKDKTQLAAQKIGTTSSGVADLSFVSISKLKGAFIGIFRESNLNMFHNTPKKESIISDKSDHTSCMDVNCTQLPKKNLKHFFRWNIFHGNKASTVDTGHCQSVVALNDDNLPSASKTHKYPLCKYNFCNDTAPKGKKRLLSLKKGQKCYTISAGDSKNSDRYSGPTQKYKFTSRNDRKGLADFEYAPTAMATAMMRSPTLEPIAEVDSVFEESGTSDKDDAEIGREEEYSFNEKSADIICDFVEDNPGDEKSSILHYSLSCENCKKNVFELFPSRDDTLLTSPMKTFNLFSTHNVANTEADGSNVMANIFPEVSIKRYPSFTDLTNLNERDYSNHCVLEHDIHNETFSAHNNLDAISKSYMPSSRAPILAYNCKNFSIKHCGGLAGIDNLSTLSFLRHDGMTSQMQSTSPRPHIIPQPIYILLNTVNNQPEPGTHFRKGINTLISGNESDFLLGDIVGAQKTFENIINCGEVQDNSSNVPLDNQCYETMRNVKGDKLGTPNIQIYSMCEDAELEQHCDTCNTCLSYLDSIDGLQCNSNSHLFYQESKSELQCNTCNSYLSYLDSIGELQFNTCNSWPSYLESKGELQCNTCKSNLFYLDSRAEPQYDTCNSCLCDHDPEDIIPDDPKSQSTERLIKNQTSLSGLTSLNRQEFPCDKNTHIKYIDTKISSMKSGIPISKTFKIAKPVLVNTGIDPIISCDLRRRSSRIKPHFSDTTKMGQHLVRHSETISSALLNPKSRMSRDKFTITTVSTVFGAPNKVPVIPEKSIKDLAASSKTAKNDDLPKPLSETTTQVSEIEKSGAIVSEVMEVGNLNLKKDENKKEMGSSQSDIFITDGEVFCLPPTIVEEERTSNSLASSPQSGEVVQILKNDEHKQEIGLNQSDIFITDGEIFCLPPTIVEEERTINSLTSSPQSGEVVEICDSDVKTIAQIDCSGDDTAQPLVPQIEQPISVPQTEPKSNNGDSSLSERSCHASKLCTSGTFISRRRNDRQNFLSRLTQRIRWSCHGSPKEYDFARRSMLHLQRCDELIQRSVEIISRSREVICNSQRQMEYTAEKMNLTRFNEFRDFDIQELI